MDVLLADADAVVFDADDDALFLALCRNADEGGRAEGRKCRLPSANCSLFSSRASMELRMRLRITCSTL